MSIYYFKEIWTPLKLVSIRFYLDDENRVWVKVWSKHRRLLKRVESTI